MRQVIVRCLRMIGALLFGSVLSVPSAGAQGSASASPYAVYVSPQTRQYYEAVGGDYAEALWPWRSYFQKRGIEAAWLEGPAQLAAWQGGVLVVPGAVALTELEQQAIAAFAHRGGGVLATWAFGSRDASGNRLGYGALRAVFGVEVRAEIEPKAPERFLIAFGDSPVAHTLPAGQRIYLGEAPQKLLALRAPSLAGRFMDWMYETELEDSGGIAYRSLGAGRAVVFGFPEAAWNYQPDAIHALIGDALSWLGSEPAAYLSAWPAGHVAAQLIEMDTEDGFANAERLHYMLRAYDIRGTFYCLTSEAKKFPDLVRKIAQQHEIAYHADIHIPFTGQPEQEQARRVATMIADMRQILPSLQHTTGFRAPEEGYDEVTERVLAAAGLRHHAAGPNASEARLPVFSPAPAATRDFVVLPRTQRDDMNFTKDGFSAREILTAVASDARRTWEMGGLGLLSVHSQTMAEGMPLAQAMPGVLEFMQRSRDKVWIAAAAEIAQWWRQRSRVKLERVATGEYTLRVEPGGKIKGLTIRANNVRPGQIPPAQLDGHVLAGRLAGPYQSVLVLPELAAGTYRLVLRGAVP
jgi:hypothetical protein